MKRVLVVDDNKDILEIISLIFEQNGFEVAATSKGEETFSSIASSSPQVILLDVFLGSMDGRELCNQLKSNPLTSHIPIIMFSAHSSWDNILKVCKADDFIAKPFNVIEILAKVNALIDNKN